MFFRVLSAARSSHDGQSHRTRALVCEDVSSENVTEEKSHRGKPDPPVRVTRFQAFFLGGGAWQLRFAITDSALFADETCKIGKNGFRRLLGSSMSQMFAAFQSSANFLDQFCSNVGKF